MSYAVMQAAEGFLKRQDCKTVSLDLALLQGDFEQTSDLVICARQASRSGSDGASRWRSEAGTQSDPDQPAEA